MMSDQQQHKFHHLAKKSPLREIDIPPRKLLARRSVDVFAADSPNSDHAVFSRFLPCNNPSDSDSDDDDPYSSDHFRIFEFKIRKCSRSRSHDWTDCPFAHPGEKARRRDPRRFHYSGTVCPDFRKGHCGKGDNCELSHGVFECWLHPSRYRTEACKDGKNCKRKICFFAHSPRQLRIVPEIDSPMNSPRRQLRIVPEIDSPMNSPRKTYCHNYTNTNMNHSNLNLNRSCCVFCHSITASPTSTLLMGMSPASPPASTPFDPRRGLHEFMSESGLTYEEALSELMASYEAMSVAETSSTPGRSKLFREGFSGGRNLMDNTTRSEGNLGGPDLGWVNDLLTEINY